MKTTMQLVVALLFCLAAKSALAQYDPFVLVGAESSDKTIQVTKTPNGDWEMSATWEYVASYNGPYVASTTIVNADKSGPNPQRIVSIFFYTIQGGVVVPVSGIQILDFTRAGSRRTSAITNDLSLNSIPDWNSTWTSKTTGTVRTKDSTQKTVKTSTVGHLVDLTESSGRWKIQIRYAKDFYNRFWYTYRPTTGTSVIITPSIAQLEKAYGHNMTLVFPDPSTPPIKTQLPTQ